MIRSRLLWTVGIVAVAGGTAVALDGPGSTSPAFEVASVKRNTSGRGAARRATGRPIRRDRHSVGAVDPVCIRHHTRPAGGRPQLGFNRLVRYYRDRRT